MAPAPATKYLDDKTSFDTYIEYTHIDNQKGILGIEVKYTEHGYKLKSGSKEDSFITNKNSRYYEISTKSNIYNSGATDLLILDDFRQIWRNQLLGESILIQDSKTFKHFTSCTIFPSGNVHFIKTCSDYMKLLSKNDRKFLPITYEDFISMGLKLTSSERIIYGLITWKKDISLGCSNSIQITTMKLIAIADTHGMHKSAEIPDGDILIHAGDLTHHGSLEDVLEFNEFLGTLPHPHKIVIAGNHDLCFEENRKVSEDLLTNCIYLQDNEVIIEGIKIYGSPWQPWFYDWAFNLERGPEIRAKWELIPEDTDVLVTHGPPYGIGDLTAQGDHAGCEDLLEVIKAIKPKLHIFGHIHEGYGLTAIRETTFINASSADQQYRLVNPPIVFDDIRKVNGSYSPI